MTGIFIHPAAVVDDGAIIGAGTKIWHWVHVSSGARIGDNCSLGQNVFVAGTAIIGNNVRIQNNVSIYDGVVLEDHVFCGPGMVFTNVYNPRCEFPRREEYRKTLVRKGATLGANCTIVCGLTIGQYAFTGAGSVILDDVPDFSLVVGNPARQVGWMSRYGERLNLPLTGNAETKCPHTGDVYKLKDGVCILSTS